MFSNSKYSYYYITLGSSDFDVLQVVSPYSAEDAKGLIKAAVRDNDPGTLYEIWCTTTILYVIYQT